MDSVQYNDELSFLTVLTRNRGRLDIFYDGSVVLKNKDKRSLFKQISSLIRILYRATHCDGCGVCIFACSEKALFVKSGVINDLEDLCVYCLTCNGFCPLLKYRNDDSFLIPS